MSPWVLRRVSLGWAGFFDLLRMASCWNRDDATIRRPKGGGVTAPTGSGRMTPGPPAAPDECVISRGRRGRRLRKRGRRRRWGLRAVCHFETLQSWTLRNVSHCEAFWLVAGGLEGSAQARKASVPSLWLGICLAVRRSLVGFRARWPLYLMVQRCHKA